ncbi:MAG: hypothetical protein ICV62_11665, partial [Cyanobacteria bacterium Co-bin13]|nr:hypothetical protein [Cyanobacteria bacterium Co-bin13]
MPHTLKKVTAYLQQAAFPYELMQGRPGLSISCQAGQAQTIAQNLAQHLA